MKSATMRTFREYNLELTSLEKSVADRKKAIQEKNERRIGRLEGKYSRFLRNSFIIGENEQIRYRELMESGLSQKKQQLKEQEKKALEAQDKRIDTFKNTDNGCEYRIYEVLKGVVDDEEEEKKIYEKEISVIQTMIEQLKKELTLSKLEQQVLTERKGILELLGVKVSALNQNKDNCKSQIYEALEEVLDNENLLQQVDISAIQERTEWLNKTIPWLEKQLRLKKINYKQVLKELEEFSSENLEKGKEMIEALKYAEISMLIRKLRVPLQDLMDKYGVGKEFLRSLCRYLRNEWEFSRGMALLNGEGDGELQISQKHIGHWEKKYGVDFIQDLVQLLCEEGIKVIKEKSKDEEEEPKNEEEKPENEEGDKEEIQEPEVNNQPISSEENINRGIIKMLENSNSISDSVSILKYLGFKFKNEEAFVNQVKQAQDEGLQGVAGNINRWITKYMIGAGNIDYRKGKKGVDWYRIALNCNGRNPRILLKKDEEGEEGDLLKKKEKGGYTIVCIAPHDDYENILQGQTKNYFQTWEGNWMERGERGGKKGRA